MQHPNKIGNAVKSLIKETALHLNLSSRELLNLVAALKLHTSPRLSFCACCLHLESVADSPLRLALNEHEEGEDIFIEEKTVSDFRFGLVYDMIQAFYLGKPSTFFETTTIESVPHIGVGLAFNNKSQPVHTPEEESDIRLQIKEFGTAPVFKVPMLPGERPNIPWNAEQDKSFAAVFNWLKQKSIKPVFRLFGYSGTGKTSLAREISWNVETGANGIPRGTVLFAAYSGKAAARLRETGCASACTVHSLIYKPQIDPLTGKPIGFILNQDSPLRFAKLLILDEVSMIDDEMGLDLLSFGVPILLLGDPGQLKPIRGLGFFTRSQDAPDVMLTTVERQAKDDPIIYLATRARLGLRLKPGTYGDSRVLAASSNITDAMIEASDQILVGTNRSRISYNTRVRRLNGNYELDTQFPVKGDRLMCIKNNKDNGLLNGTVWTCNQPEIKAIMRLKDYRNPKLGLVATNIEGLHIKLRSEDMYHSNGSPIIVNTVCSTHHFDENLPEPPWREIAGTDAFTFGYASTIHKAQGSEWGSGILIDESSIFTDQINEHRYTGITRIAKNLIIRLTD